jgi:NADH dehydrogenase (ubiquinone) Fe-S protein 2
MEFYERVSGARLHSSFIRPGGVAQDLPIGLINDISMFINQFYFRLNELKDLLVGNRIWLNRLKNVGVVDKASALSLGFSGVMLRGSGIFWDLRIADSYDGYEFLNFFIPIGLSGDCYDRFLVRIQEMYESCFIMHQCLDFLQIFVNLDDYFYNVDNHKITPPTRSFMKYNMEALIHHFKLYSEGFYVIKNEEYIVVEAPKGEFGVYIFSNDQNCPERCHIKAPGFLHLQGLNFMSLNSFLADLVAVIGTQDLVFGEVDR